MYQRSLDDRKLGSLLFSFIPIENVHIQLNETFSLFQLWDGRAFLATNPSAATGRTITSQLYALQELLSCGFSYSPGGRQLGVKRF